MFKIEGQEICWEDSKITLPEEVQNKEVTKIYGTATAGLVSCMAIYVDSNGQSVTVRSEPSGDAMRGHLVGETPKKGQVVFMREQMDPVNPDKSFWLVSGDRLDRSMNWINVEFNDGSRLVVCPFTFQYGVTNALY